MGCLRGKDRALVVSSLYLVDYWQDPSDIGVTSGNLHIGNFRAEPWHKETIGESVLVTRFVLADCSHRYPSDQMLLDARRESAWCGS